MGAVSIGKAWTETAIFVRREGGLLFPVALLFVAVPVALIMEIMPKAAMSGPASDADAARAAAELGGVGLLVVLAAILVALAGGIALSALALRPGISVGESLRLAVRRLPVMLGAGVVVGVILAVPLALAGMVSVQLAASVWIVAGLVAAIRLMLLNAVVVDRFGGVFDALRTAWALSRGQALRLSAVALVLVSLTTLGQIVGQMLFGVTGYLVGGADAGQIAAALATAAVTGVAQVYSTVMIARLYRQIVPASTQ